MDETLFPPSTEDPNAPQYPGVKAMRTSEGDLYYIRSDEAAAPEGGGAVPFMPLPAVTVTPEPQAPPETVAAKAPDNAELRALGPTPAEELAQLLPPPKEPAPEPPPELKVPPIAKQLEELAPPPEEPPPEPPADRGFVEAATAPVRMGAAKVLQHVPNLVYGIPAQLAGLLADVEEIGAAKGSTLASTKIGDLSTRDIANWLKAAAEGSKQLTEQVTGTAGQKPATPIEQGAVWTGEYVMPQKGVSAVATTGLAAIGAAIRGGLTTFGPEDVPIPSLVREAKGAEDPLAKALGLPPAGAAPAGTFPNAPQVPVAPAPNAPKVPAEPAPGSKIFTGAAGQTIIVPPPDMRVTPPPNISPKRRKGVVVESDEAFKQRFEDKWVEKEKNARTYTPTATETFKTVTGLDKMSTTEYRLIGALGAVTVGMLLGKPALALARRGMVPRSRPVLNAAPGTVTYSRRRDVFRTLDDINAPVYNAARRSGMDPHVLERMDQLYRIQTRNGGRALADSAIMEGRVETPAFRFQAPMSLADMARTAPPRSDEYLKMLETFEKIAVAKTGTVVNGHTIQSAGQAISALEASNPALRQLGKLNQGWNRAVRKFQYSGEYGTLTKQQLVELNTKQKNFIGDAVKDGNDSLLAQQDAARRLISQRLKNEAIGTYVDEMRRVDPGTFVKVSEQQLKDNPAWRRNTITFKRKGVREYYTTDPTLADTMKSDIYSITSTGGNALYAAKRTLESTTTGVLAPQFAPTSAIRSWWISKWTTEQGFRSPTVVGTVAAIPQQLVPQLAKSIAHGLEYGSGGVLNKFFPQQWTDALSKRLVDVFDNSLYFQLKTAGAHKGFYIEQAQVASSIQRATAAINAAAAANPVVKGAQTFWNGWKATFEAIHNAPSFSYARRNLGIEPISNLAHRAQRLTGDPRTVGQFFSTATNRPIRYESHNMIDKAVTETLHKGYGYTVSALQQLTPWWNPTLQGIKRIGEAYLHDPIRFTRSTVLYAMAPAAGLFYYAKSLDKDPNGKSYLDYMLNGRSAYNRQMNFYVPIPGRPVEDGIEVSFFHELAPFKRAAEIALHHMLGTNNPPEDFLFAMPDNMTTRRSLKDDLMIAAHSFLDTAIIPPMHPLISAIGGAAGVRMPQGVFGGEAYKVKGDPFNQNGGLPASFEAMTRPLLGGVADALGAFYANATQSEGGILSALRNGFKGAGASYIKKTPILRNIADVLPDRSNVTDLSSEVFENQKEINDLARFYKKWTVNEGQINVKPASTGGGIAVEEEYGLQQLGPDNPGLYQPDPKNPLYTEFMQEFYNRFMKESPNPVKGKDEGGVAFKSLWRNYGVSSRKLADLKDVNYGTYDRWQREMAPGAREELKRNHIDPTNRRDVVNFYKTMQYDALRKINDVRRATEYIMSQRAGRPIRLKDLKPYEPETESPFIYPDLVEQFGANP
jgi:hypothetical protein